MSLSIAPNHDQIYVALEAFLTGILPAGVPVIRGLPNRSSMPSPVPGFVVTQAVYQSRLMMPVDTNVTGGTTPPTTSTIQQSIEVPVQIDCYGACSGSWAATVSTTFEDAYGFAALGPSCEPLYANEARMMPLTDEELQYEEKWSVDCHLEWDPVVTVTQQYADALDLTLVDVQVKYPS
jgi:hypothetical protein